MNKKRIEEIVLESINKVLDSKTLKIEDYFDVDSLTRQDVLSIANDLTVFLFDKELSVNLTENGEIFIKENINPTLPIGVLRKELQKLGFKQWQIKTQKVFNKVRVVILYADIAKNTPVIENEMLNFGWTKARISEPRTIKGITLRVMEFDPKEQKPLTKEARKYQYLYHLTPYSNVNSILTNGLEPRSENDYLSYPPKAHVIKGNVTKSQLSQIGWMLYNKNKSLKNGNYCILRLNVQQIPEEIEFYGDPRFEFGYFTKQIIPSNAIELIGQVNYISKYNYYNEQIIFKNNKQAN